MTRRRIVIEAALAVGGLAVAHASWRREIRIHMAGDVEVIGGSADAIQRVRFESPKTWIELSPRGEGGARTVWIRAGADPETGRGERELRGGGAATALLDKIVPLRAKRAYGVLEVEKLAALEMEPPKHRLEIVLRGETRRFVVGIPADLETYLKDVLDGRVYELAYPLGIELSRIERHFLERSLHGFQMFSVNEATLTVRGRSRQLTYDPVNDAFRSASEQGKADEPLSAWHRRVWGLIVQEIYGRGETPPGGEPVIEGRLEYRGRGQIVGWIELGRQPSGKTYVRTEYLAGWNEVSSPGPELVAELGRL